MFFNALHLISSSFFPSFPQKFKETARAWREISLSFALKSKVQLQGLFYSIGYLKEALCFLGNN